MQPIKDAIKDRQYSNAVRLCEKKDIANLVLVKALKAHALSKVGRVDDARMLCSELLVRECEGWVCVVGGGGRAGPRLFAVDCATQRDTVGSDSLRRKGGCRVALHSTAVS